MVDKIEGVYGCICKDGFYGIRCEKSKWMRLEFILLSFIVIFLIHRTDFQPDVVVLH